MPRTSALLAVALAFAPAVGAQGRRPMLGTVVDKGSEPIAGAQFERHSATWSSGQDDDHALRAVAGTLNRVWIDRTVTGPDGNFACRFLDLPGTSCEARVRHGELQSADFQVVTGEEPVTLVVQ